MNVNSVFIPNNSFLHNVNQRFKILGFIFTSTSVFLAPGITGIVILLLFALLLNFLGKTRLNSFKGIIKSIIPIFIITTFMNILIMSPGTNEWWVAFTIGNFDIYIWELILSTKITLRILVLLLFATSLINSTDERAMNEGIVWLLSPLKIIKFPVSEIGIMITLAIRFIPTLIGESKLIMRSQAARGLSWYTGSFTDKFKALSNLFLPLFVTSFTRADDISNAMLARGYVVKKQRTNYFKNEINWKSWVYLSILLIMLSVVIVINFVPDFPMFLDYNWYFGEAY